MGQTNPNSLKNIEPYKIKPGEVRNPKGKAKGLKNHSTILKELCETKAEKYPFKKTREILIKTGYPSAQYAQCDNIVLTSIAAPKLETRMKATDIIMDRTSGKPAQETRLTGKDGENLFPSAEAYEKMKGLPTDALIAIQNIIQSATTATEVKEEKHDNSKRDNTDGVPESSEEI